MFLRQENKDPWLPKGTCLCVLLVSFVVLHLCLPQTAARSSFPSCPRLLSLSLYLRSSRFRLARTHPPRHPSLLSPPSNLSLLASRSAPRKLIMRHFSADRHLWGPFFFPPPVLPKKGSEVLFLPSFHLRWGWITAEWRKSRLWINQGYKLSHMVTYCGGIAGMRKALRRKSTGPENIRRGRVLQEGQRYSPGRNMNEAAEQERTLLVRLKPQQIRA